MNHTTLMPIYVLAVLFLAFSKWEVSETRTLNVNARLFKLSIPIPVVTFIGLAALLGELFVVHAP